MADNRHALAIIDAPSSENALWDEFVANSPQGTFFQTSAWTNLISNVLHRECKRLLCIRNDQPVGAMIFLAAKKFMWRTVTPAPLIPFTTPIFYAPGDEKLQKTISNYLSISSLFAKYLDDNYDFWMLDAPHTFNDSRPFIWQGASVEPKHTYIVPLNDEKAVRERFNQTIRKKLRQAESEGYRVKTENNPSVLVELISKSYHRHRRVPLIPEKILETILESALTFPNILLYALALNNEAKAARLIVLDKMTVYDVLAGSDDDRGIASVFLLDSILSTYCHSHDYFDFMGADHQEIEQFKRGFGGELKQLLRIKGKTKFPLATLIKLNEYRLNKKREL